MLVKNLLGNFVLLHPHNMTQVLQPPLLYLHNEFELPTEFVDLIVRPEAPLPLTDCAKDLAKNLPLCIKYWNHKSTAVFGKEY
jgi:hypothetical protein